MSKGGDDIADTWHAIDESTDKVVTLEILHARENGAARQRFLAEARRMAAIERPSVMRVAAIHDEARDTFIVFEHLIPLPVDLTVPTAAASDAAPASSTAADPTVVMAPPAPAKPEPVHAVSRSLASARADLSRVTPWARRFAADARRLFRDVRPEVGRLVAARSRAQLAVAARPLLARARRNRTALVGGALILLAVVFLVPVLGSAIARLPAPAPSPTAARPDTLAPAPFDLPPLAAYGAAFESQGPYPTVAPNGAVEWVVALRNTGSAGWYRGIDGAQAALALSDGTGVAVQSTPYVGPGQVGWFVVRFRARAEPGTYAVQLLPRIDGRGRLPDLGVHALVAVSKNP